MKSTGIVGAGIQWVVISLAIGFVLLVGADIYFELRNMESINARIEGWARRYPIYKGLMVFGVGAILAHLFLNS